MENNNKMIIEINNDDIMDLKYLQTVIMSLNESLIFVDKVTINDEVAFTSDEGFQGKFKKEEN